MKRTLFSLLTVVAVCFAAVSCHDEDEPVVEKSSCEVGSTGKVVSGFKSTMSAVGRQTMLVFETTLWYCPDCSRITALDYSEGIAGVLMKNSSFTLHGNSIVMDDGDVAYRNITFNDKGYITYFEDLTLTAKDEAYWSIDVEYAGDRLSKATYTHRNAMKEAIRVITYSCQWEDGLLKSLTTNNNGEESTVTYTYGNEVNVHRQPTSAMLYDMNILSLDPIRTFALAGYFGKGPDKFETSSVAIDGSSVDKSSYTFTVDEDGLIKEMLKKYESGGQEYNRLDTWTYSDKK